MAYRDSNPKNETPAFSVEDAIKEFENQEVLGNRHIVEEVTRVCVKHRSSLSRSDSMMMLHKVLDSLVDETNTLFRQSNAPFRIQNKTSFTLDPRIEGVDYLRTSLLRKGKLYDTVLCSCAWSTAGEFHVEHYEISDKALLLSKASSTGEIVGLFRYFMVSSLQKLVAAEAVTSLKKSKVW